MNCTVTGSGEDVSKSRPKMSAFVRDSQVFGDKGLLPFQNGILLSNKSLLDLKCNLNDSYKMKYLLTTKLIFVLVERHSTTIVSVNLNTLPDTDDSLTAGTSSSCLPSEHIKEAEECSTAKLLGIDNKSLQLECDEDYTLEFSGIFRCNERIKFVLYY